MSGRSIGGLWVLCDDFGNRVADFLSTDGGTVPLFLASKVLAADSSCLALLSQSVDTIDYVAVATAGRRGSELERRVVFGPSVKFASPIKTSEILEKLPSQLSRHVQPPQRRVAGIPPASWDALLRALTESLRREREDVLRLNEVLASRANRRTAALPDAIEFERDAAAVALETFRGSGVRQRYLGAAPIRPDAPFIEALSKSGANVLEDRMIDNDLATFPGASAVRRHLIGAITVTLETGSLTIVNANRTGIEKTLGVDLIYYHHVFDSFTMVQYKRMTGRENPVYRPSADRSYFAEISRMKAFLSNRSTESSQDLQSFRLGTNPFLFKLCPAQNKEHWSRMLPGMYIPLDLWERFLSSEEVLGPRGGVAIGYDNTHRRFTNSDFVRLVRGGWIGSHGVDSQRINQIIEQELSADKSIIVAIHTERRMSEEFLRDARGRFASEDDSDAL
jgi:hypothetical protein